MESSANTFEPMVNKEIDITIECSICYSIIDNDNLLLTECNHTFCIQCFKQYIISKKIQQILCPMCRQNVNNVTILNEPEIEGIQYLLHQRRLILMESFQRNFILFHLSELIDNIINFNEVIREEDIAEYDDINSVLFTGCIQLIMQIILFICLVLKIFIIVYSHIHQIIWESLCGWYQLIVDILRWLKLHSVNNWNNTQEQNRHNRRIDLN